jgi:hypothetical protein
MGDTNITTVNTGLLNSGDTTSLTFTNAQSFKPVASGSYTLKFYTSLEGDTNHSNDTTIIQLTVIDSSRDAGVTAVTTNITGPIYAGTNISLKAKVKNFGLANLPSVPVHYRVVGDSDITSLNTGILNSGDTSSILFTGSRSFTPVTRGNYILKFFTTLTGDTNFNNDTTTISLAVIDSIGTTIFISVIPQGLFNSITSELNRRDTVKAYLREVNSPYNIVDSATAVIDSLTFEGQFRFPTAPNGIYYIVVTHRNSIETWSGSGFNTFPTDIAALSYNFTANQSRAYGNNMIKVDPILNSYAIYTGDVNQDGSIDGSDLSIIDNAAFNFVTGYVVQDCNGDDVVDGSDAVIASNNAENFVTKITP